MAWKSLIVDDHSMIRFAVSAMVRELGLCTVVGEACNGAEAVKLALRLGSAGLDLIFMDVSMPVMGGAEATARILQALPSVRVIGLSMHKDAQALEEMIVAGARSYLHKDESAEALRRAIIDTMAGNAHFTDAAAAALISLIRTPGVFGGHHFAPREFETLRLAAAGFSVKETAEAMKVEQSTVRGYRKAIAGKTGFSGRRGLTSFYNDHAGTPA